MGKSPMRESDVDLLGEPRLKNGLTYYPGLQTKQGRIVLGNVVQLNLKTDEGLTYTGYGYLKGVWLWRDEPYMRVQYLAPFAAVGMPTGAIAFTELRSPGRNELMVTNRVGDLHLSQLVGVVPQAARLAS